MLNTHPLPTVEDSCGNCKFWMSWEPWEDDFDRGECHRNAPSPVRDSQTEDDLEPTHWPNTYLKQWCGEHQPRTPAADSAPLTKPADDGTVLCPTFPHDMPDSVRKLVLSCGRDPAVRLADGFMAHDIATGQRWKLDRGQWKPCTRPSDIVD